MRSAKNPEKSKHCNYLQVYAKNDIKKSFLKFLKINLKYPARKFGNAVLSYE